MGILVGSTSSKALLLISQETEIHHLWSLFIDIRFCFASTISFYNFTQSSTSAPSLFNSHSSGWLLQYQCNSGQCNLILYHAIASIILLASLLVQWNGFPWEILVAKCTFMKFVTFCLMRVYIYWIKLVCAELALCLPPTPIDMLLVNVPREAFLAAGALCW